MSRYFYFKLFNPNICFCCWFPIIRNSQLVWHWEQWQLICTRQHIKYIRKKSLTKVSKDMSCCTFEEPANTWVTSPRITINLTFCIHEKRWGGWGGSIRKLLQWRLLLWVGISSDPVSTKRERIWPHWDMERLGMCTVVLNVIVRLLLCLFFHVV